MVLRSIRPLVGIEEVLGEWRAAVGRAIIDGYAYCLLLYKVYIALILDL